ncbi:MAG: DUF559 domain-containing protein [Mesorhizobium sp.]|nr:DUF559 domain-containing protein [Mesorhizobium sp.]
MTDAEKVLWKNLRGDFAGKGTHFRRQVAIGRYVADFCCPGHKLIVEVDGPIHLQVEVHSHDRLRDEVLRAGGYRILRFTNTEVSLELKSVLQRISTALSASTPTPVPSPQGGGKFMEPT